MPVLIRVPRLYPEMEEATVGEWLLSEGAAAEPRTPLVQIITEKVAFDVEAPEGTEGMLLRTACLPEKSAAAVDSVLAVLAAPGEVDLPDWREANERTGRVPQSDQPGSDSRAAAPKAAPAFPSQQDGVIRATPAARRAARAAGVTLEEIAAEFPDQTLTEMSVQSYLMRRI